MKRIMKQAVDTVYKLLWLREYEPRQYDEQIHFGALYTRHWDDPQHDRVNGKRGKPKAPQL
jgi:hypothetical protein